MSTMAAVNDKKPKGLAAATFTPLTTDGEINLSLIGPYVDYLTQKQGVKQIFVNGTAGEGMSLTVAERKMLAEEWCKKAKGKMDYVIVHVGCLSFRDSQELARHAVEIEADAIAAIAPFFLKPNSADALRKFLQEVASAAPTLPFYYYHIPSITGVNVSVPDVLEDIGSLIPSFSGVKFSSADLMEFGLCFSHSPPHWTFLFGVDEQLLSGLAMGAQGAVGSTYNYMGSQMNKLIAAFENNNLEEARRIQFKMQDLIQYAKTLGFDLGVNKQLMSELSGLSLGPPRLPVMPCPPEHGRSIAQKFHSLFPEASVLMQHVMGNHL
ncbi:N-acetylneuraminate lyase [Notolabrus celidotus]|uniref:N-acetylneuraminate lyase n=1 Tax=Notolabrus celidotus TaxID=1203425 RepID=UPI0014900B20|nr:N-acetylneuraminate lyase [Notolabrus celidotus]